VDSCAFEISWSVFWHKMMDCMKPNESLYYFVCHLLNRTAFFDTVDKAGIGSHALWGGCYCQMKKTFATSAYSGYDDIGYNTQDLQTVSSLQANGPPLQILPLQIPAPFRALPFSTGLRFPPWIKRRLSLCGKDFLREVSTVVELRAIKSITAIRGVSKVRLHVDVRLLPGAEQL
jgi:hypothetical protein